MIFPDSSIANKMSVGSTKLSYYITYGLGPFYHNNLLQAIEGCSEIVTCFDEAMNCISQHGQINIVVRYWDVKDDIVSTRYFGSAFMGRATSDDFLASFRSAIAAILLMSLSKTICAPIKRLILALQLARFLQQYLYLIWNTKFRMQCIEFLSATVAALVDRCTLKYGIVRAVSCLVPSTVASHEVLAERRMTNLAQTLYYTNHVSAVTADRASQFAALMVDAKGKFQDDFANFRRSKDQLDTLYFHIIGRICKKIHWWLSELYMMQSKHVVVWLQWTSLKPCCSTYAGLMLTTRMCLNVRERRLQRKQKELHRRNEQRKTLIILKPRKSKLCRRLLWNVTRETVKYQNWKNSTRMHSLQDLRHLESLSFMFHDSFQYYCGNSVL